MSLRSYRSFFLIIILTGMLLFLSSCSKPKPAQHVIYILLDTLRADHLSSYGYSRPTSPVLDAFAKENTIFEHAVTAAPWTPASMASMITGLYPTRHRMMPPNSRDLARKESTKLNPALQTLAEEFQKNGFYTVGITTNPWTNKSFGYDQGYDWYIYDERAPADVVTKRANKAIDLYLEDPKRKSRMFLYVHYLDPHDPYKPPTPYDSMFPGAVTDDKSKYDPRMSEFIGKYDGEIRFLDTELAKLFQHLKDKGLYESTAIIIVGDHGEQFMEHGNHRHGYELYQEELHVPLLLRSLRSSMNGQRPAQTVSTVDVFATALELAGLPVPEKLDSISLLNTKAQEKREGVLSEIRRLYDEKSFTDRFGKKIVLGVPFQEKHSSWEISEKAWTAKENRPAEVLGVYDRLHDAHDSQPVDDKALEVELTKQFWKHYTGIQLLSSPADEYQGEIDDESLEQLRSLGYIE
jgi:arylsulfatase A-like enzyme